MVRTIKLVLLFTILACMLSCSQNNKYKVLEVGGYDYMSDSDHKSEINLNDEDYTDNTLNDNKTIEYNGVTYNCNYNFSSKGYRYNDDIDYYVTPKKDGEIVEFGINRQNGRIDYYSWVDFDYLDNINETKKSRDECLSIAKNYFGNYVDDVSEYELIEERVLDLPEYEKIYKFEFVRVIDGVKTSDRANISVTVYGKISSHLFISLGEMKNAVLPSEKEMGIIRENIDSKMADIYSKAGDSYEISYETQDEIFIKMANGKYAFEYYIDVDIISINDSSPLFAELTRLVVYLE